VLPVADVASVDLEVLGPRLETHPAFPARTNVHFVQVLSPTHLVMRVWERGAGPTLACGTGACATLVACHCLGLCERRARLDLPGGALEIHWEAVSGHVFMTGPAEAVFDAVVAPGLLEDALEPEPGRAGALEPTGGATAGEAQAFQASGGDSEPVDSEPIDCSTACRNGCLRPEACPSAESRARVTAMLEGFSLDELVAIADHSLEARSRARIDQGRGRSG
jgi:diaminopimelate epimerase